MANVLAVPFHLAPNGSASTVIQGTDPYYSQQIATVILTIEGERKFDPDFGMPDMAFDSFQRSSFQHQLDQYIPGIVSATVTTDSITDVTQSVTIHFETEG